MLTPAKVNLYLTVGVLRPADGRHEIRTVFYPFRAVCDQVTVSANPSGSGMTLSLTGRPIPGGASVEENLACRSVLAYCRRFGLPADFHVAIEKAIPVGGGMGGGSSDAAAALLEMNRIMKNQAKPSEMHLLAASLGADVPFFLHPAPSLATGIGEVLTPTGDFPELHLLAIYPGFPSPVAWAYQNWHRPSGITPPEWPPSAETDWSQALWNDLGFAVAEKYPPIQRALDDLMEQGARRAIVSGSGASVFGLFQTREMRDAAKIVLSRKWEVF